MGIFQIKKQKAREEPKQETYYIEPTKEEDPETHENWEEQQEDKPWF